MDNKKITLDNKPATLEQIDEAKKECTAGQRIIETKPGEFHKLERMQD